MRTIAIACRTIEDEINAVVKALPGCCPVRWVESGLHNFPVKLKDRIQQEIDIIDGAENILLLFGYCGNSVEGLRASKSRLVLPKVDDCISLLLGSNQARLEVGCQARSYFLTDGWLRYENNIYQEFLHCVKKYGQDKALGVFRTMLANYSALAFIDTGTYDLDHLMAKTSEFAASLNLTQVVVPGTLSLIDKAFKEEWDDDFLKVPPGMALSLSFSPAAPPNQL
ncbi:MAG: DUF1638 domain-containing protein [Bacillota bacterium]